MTIKKDVKDSVIELYENCQDMTQKAIGDRLGIGRDTVLKILREYGVASRSYTGDRSMPPTTSYDTFIKFVYRKG